VFFAGNRLEKDEQPHRLLGLLLGSS